MAVRRYVTKDYAVTIVDGNIVFRYWAVTYSTSLNDQNKCRLLAHINGLSYHVYNNTPRYDQMRDILREMYSPGLPSFS